MACGSCGASGLFSLPRVPELFSVSLRGVEHCCVDGGFPFLWARKCLHPSTISPSLEHDLDPPCSIQSGALPRILGLIPVVNALSANLVGFRTCAMSHPWTVLELGPSWSPRFFRHSFRTTSRITLLPSQANDHLLSPSQTNHAFSASLRRNHFHVDQLSELKRMSLQALSCYPFSGLFVRLDVWTHAVNDQSSPHTSAIPESDVSCRWYSAALRTLDRLNQTMSFTAHSNCCSRTLLVTLLLSNSCQQAWFGLQHFDAVLSVVAHDIRMTLALTLKKQLDAKLSAPYVDTNVALRVFVLRSVDTKTGRLVPAPVVSLSSVSTPALQFTHMTSDITVVRALVSSITGTCL